MATVIIMNTEQFLMFWDKIKDKYLTWKTGMDKQTRDWHKWRNETLNHRAFTVKNYFVNFKYIVEVSYFKVLDHHDPFGDFIRPEFKEYTYPQKPLNQNAVVMTFRGDWDPWDKQFHIHDFGYDVTFVATNSEEDAVMIALRFG